MTYIQLELTLAKIEMHTRRLAQLGVQWAAQVDSASHTTQQAA